jgi:hypothetical protein
MHKKPSPAKQKQNYTRAEYLDALHQFDSRICEAIAVSQAQAGRNTTSEVGFASKIFARMCTHAVSLIRAAPLSRWVTSDFGHWDFSTIAGHSRAILEGHLLFNYLLKPSSGDAEIATRINVMHINDCTRRLELHVDMGASAEEVAEFERQREEIRERLRRNVYFNTLPPAVQKKCLNGKYLMIDARDELVSSIGFEKGAFNAIYDFLSQYTHILPLSFYRMEPNGRGTGIENDTDRSYMCTSLNLCSDSLKAATDKLTSIFHDVQMVRQGINSKFSPGPAANKPDHRVNQPSATPTRLPSERPLSASLKAAFSPKD